MSNNREIPTELTFHNVCQWAQSIFAEVFDKLSHHYPLTLRERQENAKQVTLSETCQPWPPDMSKNMILVGNYDHPPHIGREVFAYMRRDSSPPGYVVYLDHNAYLEVSDITRISFDEPFSELFDEDTKLDTAKTRIRTLLCYFFLASNHSQEIKWSKFPAEFRACCKEIAKKEQNPATSERMQEVHKQGKRKREQDEGTQEGDGKGVDRSNMTSPTRHLRRASLDDDPDNDLPSEQADVANLRRRIASTMKSFDDKIKECDKLNLMLEEANEAIGIEKRKILEEQVKNLEQWNRAEKERKRANAAEKRTTELEERYER